VATLSFYLVLFLAGGDDVLASTFGLALETMIHIFQASLLIVPAVSGYVAWRVCKELSRQRAHPIQRPIAGVVTRTVTGGYEVVGETAGDGRAEPALEAGPEG
jgi:ubiquinol-cytochrome c reductase cytochrome b subunit